MRSWPRVRRPRLLSSRSDAVHRDAPATERGIVASVVALTIIGAALRFSTLDLQSFWFDEVATVEIIRKPFGAMLRAVADLTPTPPLYYVIAWTWAKVFGTGEVGLRALSALVGTASVPLVYQCGRVLHSRRAGLFAAAFVAVSPLLVWYSQEARAYALVVTLCAASFLFFIRALEQPDGRLLSFWTAASGLALLTHYFAIFVIAPEALWLLFAARGRRVVLSVGALFVVAIPLAGLALHQEHTGQVAWITGIPLRSRAYEVISRFLGGGYLVPHATAAALVLGATALLLVVGSSDRRTRRGAFVTTLLAVVALGTPLGLAYVGHDYFYFRNLIVAWVPLALFLAIALASARPVWTGVVGAVALCATCVAVLAPVWFRADLQRDDWRGFAQGLVRIKAPFAVVARPGFESASVEHYAPRLRPLPAGGMRVEEVVVVGYPFFGDPFPPPDIRLPSQFKVTAVRRTGRLKTIVFRVPHPVLVVPSNFNEHLRAGQIDRSVLSGRGHNRREARPA